MKKTEMSAHKAKLLSQPKPRSNIRGHKFIADLMYYLTGCHGEVEVGFGILELSESLGRMEMQQSDGKCAPIDRHQQIRRHFGLSRKCTSISC